jgi:hypothetical protein
MTTAGACMYSTKEKLLARAWLFCGDRVTLPSPTGRQGLR